MKGWSVSGGINGMGDPHNEKNTPSGVCYLISNWSDYNRALIDRGDFTFWVSEDVIEVWLELSCRPPIAPRCGEGCQGLP